MTLLGKACGLIATITLALLAARPAHADPTVLKIGTAIPQDSPWGAVLKVWARSVDARSNGALELDLQWEVGDDSAMVASLGGDHLDGALLGGVGLGEIYKPIASLELPGLLTSWAKLDAARDAMSDAFHKGASDAGVTILGWTDFGAAHLMSHGAGVTTPADLETAKPLVAHGDDLRAAVYHAISGVTPVSLAVGDVAGQLGSGVTVVDVPALLAEQLQWASHLDTINDDVTSLRIGALVLSSKRLASLPQGQRDLLVETGAIAATNLRARIRTLDDQARARLEQHWTVEKLTADQSAQWADVYAHARASLTKRDGTGVFDPDLVHKLEGLAR